MIGKRVKGFVHGMKFVGAMCRSVSIAGQYETYEVLPSTGGSFLLHVDSMEYDRDNNIEEDKGIYQCVYLNPEYKLGHDDGAEILFCSDDLAACCFFVCEKFHYEKKDIAVWQPASGCYREVYQNKARDTAGRFCKR